MHGKARSAGIYTLVDKQARSRQKVVAANIRRLRILANLTQAKLADKLDVTQQQVQKWERGSVSFSTSRLDTLAEAFSCDVTELLNPISADQASTQLPENRARPLSAMECRLLDAFAQITELSRKRLVLKLAQALGPEAAED